MLKFQSVKDSIYTMYKVSFIQRNLFFKANLFSFFIEFLISL
ncbi:hypothetical protein Riean_0207 [Riemerella anatipestifer ATCC 11845 = DSM 15868]|nr:hypothetical protein Riean_0207 [Riemerella anatipestifer ATCC 11845 = DSM 15868]AIH01247.1 hypothetical protein M949_0076 [Riemerella anatipestifer CH3]